MFFADGYKCLCWTSIKLLQHLVVQTLYSIKYRLCSWFFNFIQLYSFIHTIVCYEFSICYHISKLWIFTFIIVILLNLSFADNQVLHTLPNRCVQKAVDDRIYPCACHSYPMNYHTDGHCSSCVWPKSIMISVKPNIDDVLR